VRAVEVVELLLEAPGFAVSALVAAERQCFLPCCAGLGVVSEGGVGVADAVEGAGEVVGVADGAEQGDGVVVVGEGLVVVAGVVGDESEAVLGACFAVEVVVVPEGSVRGRCPGGLGVRRTSPPG
jgi:hypothetical protein